MNEKELTSLSMIDRLEMQGFGLLSEIASQSKLRYDQSLAKSQWNAQRLREHMRHFLHRSELYPAIFSRAATKLISLSQTSVLNFRYASLYNYIAWIECGGDQADPESAESLLETLLSDQNRHAMLLERDLQEVFGCKIQGIESEATNRWFYEVSDVLASDQEEFRVGALLAVYSFAKLHIDNLWQQIRELVKAENHAIAYPFYVCHAIQNGPEKSILLKFVEERSRQSEGVWDLAKVSEGAANALHANIQWIGLTTDNG